MMGNQKIGTFACRRRLIVNARKNLLEQPMGELIENPVPDQHARRTCMISERIAREPPTRLRVAESLAAFRQPGAGRKKSLRPSSGELLKCAHKETHVCCLLLRESHTAPRVAKPTTRTSGANAMKTQPSDARKIRG